MYDLEGVCCRPVKHRAQVRSMPWGAKFQLWNYSPPSRLQLWPGRKTVETVSCWKSRVTYHVTAVWSAFWANLDKWLVAHNNVYFGNAGIYRSTTLSQRRITKWPRVVMGLVPTLHTFMEVLILPGQDLTNLLTDLHPQAGFRPTFLHTAVRTFFQKRSPKIISALLEMLWCWLWDKVQAP